MVRDLRLAALRDAPGAFASTYAAECDAADAHWRELVGRFAWFVARDARPLGLAAGRPSAEGRHGLVSMWVHPGVTLAGPGGPSDPHATRVWAAGVAASPLARLLAERAGAGVRHAVHRAAVIHVMYLIGWRNRFGTIYTRGPRN